MKLTAAQLVKLNDFHNAAEFDSKFVSYLLLVVFGKEVLRNSSYGGARSNKNKQRIHHALDPEKIESIESKISLYSLILFYHSLS